MHNLPLNGSYFLSDFMQTPHNRMTRPLHHTIKSFARFPFLEKEGKKKTVTHVEPRAYIGETA